jgi:hypothetical protein
VSTSLRWEQCCGEPGCKRPARYGDLCTTHFQAATPARRATELLIEANPQAAMDAWTCAAYAELMLGD